MAPIVPDRLDGGRSSNRFAWKSRPPTLGSADAIRVTFAVDFVTRRLEELNIDESETHGAVVSGLYQLLAGRVRNAHYETDRIAVRRLHKILWVRPNAVREARDELIARGEIALVEGGQGKPFARYALLQLLGPVIVATWNDSHRGARPETAVQDRSAADDKLSSEIEVDGVPRSCTARRPAELRRLKIEAPPDLRSNGSYVASDTSYVLEEEEEPSPSEGASERETAARWQRAAAAADRFLAWWTAAYPTHNGGIPNDPRASDRAAAINGLLRGLTVDYLQELAIVEWSIDDDGVDNSDRQFIAQSDRSVRVLFHKLTFLGQELRRQIRDRERLSARTAAAAAAAAHASSDTIAAHVVRVRARLIEIRDTVPPILGEAIGRVLADLDDGPSHDSLATCLGAHEAALLEAARFADADSLSACEGEADRELASLRTTTPPDAYRRAHAGAVDRLVREHYRLPVLTPSRGWPRL